MPLQGKPTVRTTPATYAEQRTWDALDRTALDLSIYLAKLPAVRRAELTSALDKLIHEVKLAILAG